MSMIDQEKLAAIKASMAAGEVVRDPLQDMSEADLRRLRADIDRVLPERTTLADMDMPKELMEQFQRVKDLQDEVLGDEDVPANQKAQVAGQVASTLQQLVKMQTDFYNAERFRSIENLMIKFMKKMPLDVATEFVAEYEKLGDEIG